MNGRVQRRDRAGQASFGLSGWLVVTFLGMILGPETRGSVGQWLDRITSSVARSTHG